MKKAIKLFIILICVFSVLFVVPVCSKSTIDYPVADTYVSGYNDAVKSVNYGEADYVILKPCGGNRYPFYKFDISEIRSNLSADTEIESAKIVLYVMGADGTAKSTAYNVSTRLYYVENDNWQEGNGKNNGTNVSGINFNSMPEKGEMISFNTIIPAGTEYKEGKSPFVAEYDITGALKSELAKADDNYLSCTLDGDTYVNQTLAFFSDENTELNGKYRPILKVNYRIKKEEIKDRVLAPISDTYVDSVASVTDKNYGGANHLILKVDNRYVYLKYDISEISPENVESAKIRVYAIGSNRNGKETPTEKDVNIKAYYVAEDSWAEGTGDKDGFNDTENGISFLNRPEISDAVSEAVTIPKGTVYEPGYAPPYFDIDVTGALLNEKDDILSLALNGDDYVNQNIYFFSDENPVVKNIGPNLIIKYKDPSVEIMGNASEYVSPTKIKTSVKVKNTTDKEEKTVVVFALYKNSQLINLISEEQTIDSGDTRFFDKTFDIPFENEEYYVKAFVWNNEISLIPIKSGEKVHPFGLYHSDDVLKLHNKMAQKPYSEEYKRQKNIADKHNVQELETYLDYDADYTLLKWDDVFEEMQCNANVYMYSGVASYAEKAKMLMNYVLENMIRGMEYRININEIRDDTYGAVTIGRGIGGVAITYDMIKNSGVISGWEDMLIRKKAYYVADTLMNTDYYAYKTPGYWQESNWNSDRCSGVGMFAIIFNEYEKSEEYLNHAVDTILWQFENVVGVKGDYTENIRYTGAVMHRFATFFKMLKNYNGTNLFDNEKFKKMIKYLINIQTPADFITNNGYINIPAIGDTGYLENIYRLLGYIAPEYAESDPKLCAEMMYTWARAGYPVRDSGTQLYPIMAFSSDRTLTEKAPVLSSVRYEGVGYSIFRENAGTAEENYLLIKNAPKKLNHCHNDEGNFILYYHQTPILLDSGVEKYTDDSYVDWYPTSYAHNTVQFADDNGGFKNGPVNSTVDEHYSSDLIDYHKSRIPDESAKFYERTVAGIKNGFGIYVIWDNIKSENKSRFNLHTLSTAVEMLDSKNLLASCYNYIDLQISVAQPVNANIKIQQPGKLAMDKPFDTQKHLTIDGAENEDYLVFFYPKNENEENIGVETILCDNSALNVYKITKSDGNFVVVITNNSENDIEMDLPVDCDLVDLKTKEVFAGDGTKVVAKGNSVTVLGKVN